MQQQVSTQILFPIVEKLRGAGVVAAPLLDQVGIDRDKLEDVNHFTSLSAYLEFFELAAKSINNPHFGLDCGRNMDSGSLGAASFLFLSAPTLKDAFRGLTDYLDALQSATESRLVIEEDEARFIYHIPDNSLIHRRQDAEYSIAATFNLSKQYLKRSFSPREVHFEHVRVGFHQTYEDYFGCDVFFEQPKNMIGFDAALLDTSAPAISHKLFPIIAAHLQERIDQKKMPRTFREQVESLIDVQSLSAGKGNSSGIASALGISESTLARRLKSEETSFAEVLTNQRMSIAQRLLGQGEQPIAQIAIMVGYAENASFSRAFKTFSGMTPEAYRIRARK